MTKILPLQELIDINELQGIQDNFAKTVGISSVIFSPEGKPLTHFSNPTDFCSLIQSTDKGKQLCFRSFMEMSKKAIHLKESKILYCFVQGGHFVAPIIVNKKHIGTMFAGQFIPRKFSPQQLKKIERMAVKINIDPKRLVKEAKKMRVIKESIVWDYSSLFFQIVEVITKMGKQASELNRAKDALQKAHDKLEIRVMERTSELQKSNKQLKQEITERKLAEKKLKQTMDELESVNNELKDFAHIVSHDLKAPLRAINTLTNWISTDYADKLDKDGREQIDLLLNRVKRMHDLIDGILKYSRAGHIKEEKVEINLNTLVTEVIDMISPPENIKIKIINNLPSIISERTRIEQVFQNLISNAVKFIDKPKGIIRINCVEDNGYWKFIVADNGPGIEEKYFTKIFQIFQTLQTGNEFESTGVGLTTTKKIIEMYSGKIWVESKVGNGSTFFFTLPK